MKNEKKKEYGLVTLMSAVIGTVIGSGIFFKTEEILNITNGNVLLGFFILLAGGGITLTCASAFALLSAERGSEGGVVGYAEKTCGRGLSRFAAIFSADFYLPSMTAALAFVSGGYFCALLNAGESAALRIAVSGAFLVIFFAANTLAPRATAAFQVVTAILKLLPILSVGAVGCIAFLKGGGELVIPTEYGGVASALLSSAFAYEGWIAVTVLGDGVKNPRKNMPLALTLGTAAVLAVYLLYYFGVVGASSDGNSVKAFESIFGSAGGRLMLVFVTVSCLGVLNGLTMSVTRGHYILSKTLGRGDEKSGLFSEVSERTGIPVLSGVMGLLVSEIWLCFFAARDIWAREGVLKLDPAEASISMMYGIYVPIFVMTAVRLKGLPPVKRFVLPIFAAGAATAVAVAAPIAFGAASFWFLLAVAAVSVGVLVIYRP